MSGKRPSPQRPKRRFRFTKAAALVEKRVQAAGESRGFALPRLLTQWDEVAGDLAQIARPVKVSYGKSGLGGVLTVLTTGPQAPLLEMQKETLRSRINACYGYAAISRIAITQTAPSGFAEGQAVFTPAPSAAKAPSPAVRRDAAAAAAPVADPGLRAALEHLGCNVLAANRRKDPR